MAIYYNNDARLLMDIKPNAVPFVGEDFVVPILTAMTAGERESCVNGFIDIMGMNERHKERNGELYHAIRNFGKAMNLHCSRPSSPEETAALSAHFAATLGKKSDKNHD